jgi:hypothetical protein
MAPRTPPLLVALSLGKTELSSWGGAQALPLFIFLSEPE